MNRALFPIGPPLSPTPPNLLQVRSVAAPQREEGPRHARQSKSRYQSRPSDVTTLRVTILHACPAGSTFHCRLPHEALPHRDSEAAGRRATRAPAQCRARVPAAPPLVPMKRTGQRVLRRLGEIDRATGRATNAVGLCARVPRSWVRTRVRLREIDRAIIAAQATHGEGPARATSELARRSSPPRPPPPARRASRRRRSWGRRWLLLRLPSCGRRPATR